MREEEQLSRFDVAIWVRWHRWQTFPVLGVVSASDAEAAVETVMWAFQIERAEHVAAHDLAGGLTYRAFDVVLGPERPLVTPKGESGEASRQAHQASWDLEALRQISQETRQAGRSK